MKLTLQIITMLLSVIIGATAKNHLDLLLKVIILTILYFTVLHLCGIPA